MGFTDTCPECGTSIIKTLVAVTESAPAYLCGNGHFFLAPVPVALHLALSSNVEPLGAD